GGSGGGVSFSGRAYPRSTITFLKDAQVAATTIADSLAQFSTTLSNLTPGNYTFSVYSEDAQGRRSSLLTFPVGVTAGVVTNITGIYITPTIAVDKSEVKKGDDIAIFGQTAVQSDVTIQVNSDEPFFVKTKADAGGVYLFNFDTTPLEYGDHSTKSKSAIGGEISSYSSAVGFKVGDKNVGVVVTPRTCTVRGDVNKDCRVNLVDFSIVAYWYKRASPPTHVDLNNDKKVTLVDFSVLAFNWTG
ncbi:MAG TPA: dockerin type I domain-containing protein, partial [Candidatus Paceibacterota bacterium]|nr:dockerin type I domain-containing protein [Candidatus Paceibacterota bacterium]